MINLFENIYSKLNNKPNVLDIPPIGTVLLEKSNRAKHINISIKPIGKIRAAVPLGVSFKTAETFVYSRIDWSRKHLSKTTKTRNQLNIYREFKTLSNILNLNMNKSLQKTDDNIH